MLRSDAIQSIYPELKECAVVTIMGATAAELFACGHQPNFFYLEHAMGLASSMGLGIALSRPDLQVVVLDGDTQADDDPEVTLVRLAKEEEGIGISTGAHLAGVKSALLMQNHGFLASINGIVSLAQLYRIPLLMLISYRGTFGEEHPWQTEGAPVADTATADERCNRRWTLICAD